MKLMIVDDSNIMRRAIQKYLSPMGLDLAATAADGITALRLFGQYRPDVVTMDITMPELDGLGCLVEMLKIKPDTRVLIVTALSDPETGLEAVRKGARGFLTKPFTEAELQEEISHVMGV
ncbi:response regulator [Spirochaeta africana]|uniref:Response regulator containing CheY-like receiver domain and AraC-type DNA-binding domain n=1 Tax=Spirochaeta africana (strain ATCC 700263 / DSM 8902 / Z-7692) TaxID=889378 RepID=H9UGR4_SPIAZ|nr:response regulator [Spirochaeta africana]AFG36707.1 response regulator containing CheY-like receiver domain and AraC-type DNA-binding domain [Spirochaeta africana DSM 8902]